MQMPIMGSEMLICHNYKNTILGIHAHDNDMEERCSHNGMGSVVVVFWGRNFWFNVVLVHN